jgi:hypothetical protein
MRRARLGSFRKSTFWRRCDIVKSAVGFVSQIAVLTRESGMHAWIAYGVNYSRTETCVTRSLAERGRFPYRTDAKTVQECHFDDAVNRSRFGADLATRVSKRAWPMGNASPTLSIIVCVTGTIDSETSDLPRRHADRACRIVRRTSNQPGLAPEREVEFGAGYRRNRPGREDTVRTVSHWCPGLGSRVSEV